MELAARTSDTIDLETATMVKEAFHKYTEDLLAKTLPNDPAKLKEIQNLMDDPIARNRFIREHEKLEVNADAVPKPEDARGFLRFVYTEEEHTEYCHGLMASAMFDEKKLHSPDFSIDPSNFDTYDYDDLEKNGHNGMECADYRAQFHAVKSVIADYNKKHGWFNFMFQPVNNTADGYLSEHPSAKNWNVKTKAGEATYYPSATGSKYTLILIPGLTMEWRSHQMMFFAGTSRMMGFNVVLMHEWQSLDGPGDLNAADVTGLINEFIAGKHPGIYRSTWDQIGIASWSYGTKAAQHTLFIRPEIKAAWLDGLYYDGQMVMMDAMGESKVRPSIPCVPRATRRKIAKPYSKVMVQELYECLRFVRKWAVFVNQKKPWELVNSGSPSEFIQHCEKDTNRSIHILNPIQDKITMIEQAQHGAKEIRSYGYHVTEWWADMGDEDRCKHHLNVHLKYPLTYINKYCNFWGEIFKFTTAEMANCLAVSTKFGVTKDEMYPAGGGVPSCQDLQEAAKLDSSLGPVEP